MAIIIMIMMLLMMMTTATRATHVHTNVTQRFLLEDSLFTIEQHAGDIVMVPTSWCEVVTLAGIMHTFMQNLRDR
jgi:hypothetical protein